MKRGFLFLSMPFSFLKVLYNSLILKINLQSYDIIIYIILYSLYKLNFIPLRHYGLRSSLKTKIKWEFVISQSAAILERMVTWPGGLGDQAKTWERQEGWGKSEGATSSSNSRSQWLSGRSKKNHHHGHFFINFLTIKFVKQIAQLQRTHLANVRVK